MARIAVGILVVLLIAPLSGCFGSDDKKTDDGDKKDAGTGDGNGTAAPVVAPIASLKVLIDGNETAANATSGTIDAKVGVNVTFDASNTTGDDVVFAWDFGDGETIGEIPATNSTDGNSTGNSTGNATVVMPILQSLYFQEGNETNATGNASGEPTELPENAIVEHAFAEAGTYNVTLYATNDAGTSTATVSLLVASSGPPPGTEMFKETKALGSAAGSANPGYMGGIASETCSAKSTATWEILGADANGTAVTIKEIKITIAAFGGTGTQGGKMKLWLLAPDGTEVKKDEAAGTAAKTLTVTGPLAAGTYKVEGQKCATLSVNAPASAITGVATYVSV